MAGLEVIITTNRQDLKLPLISPWNLIPDLSIQILDKVTIPSPSNIAEWGSNSPDDERVIPTFHWEDSNFKKKGLEKLRIKDHKTMASIGMTERDQILTVLSIEKMGNTKWS